MSEEIIPKYPHCDMRVLHAPGQCIYCDKHKDWQEQRIADRVNFTGQTLEGLAPCPADAARGDKHALWPGNRPYQAETDYAGFSSGPLAYPAHTGFTPRPTFWQRFGPRLKSFFLWAFLGHICPQCKVERTGEWQREWDLFGKVSGLYRCDDCSHKNRLANWERKDAREREARIEEMAEAIRRVGCAKKES